MAAGESGGSNPSVIEMHGRASILALGSLIDPVAVASVTAAGSYLSGRLGYELSLQGVTVAGVVCDVVICDSVGKIRRFSDLGAALEKLRRVLDPVPLSVVTVTVSNAPVHALSVNVEAASAKRALQLGKMQTANGLLLAAGEASLLTIAGWGALGGSSAVRYAEVLARVQALRNDAAVIAAHLAALPVLSVKPDA